MIEPALTDRDADRGDLLADIDIALGPALDKVLRRYVPAPAARELRREIIEYIGDVVTSAPTATATACCTS